MMKGTCIAQPIEQKPIEQKSLGELFFTPLRETTFPVGLCKMLVKTASFYAMEPKNVSTSHKDFWTLKIFGRC